MVSGVHLYFSGLIDSGRPPVSGFKSKLVCLPPNSKQLTFRHSCKQIQTGHEIGKCHVLLKCLGFPKHAKHKILIHLLDQV